MCAEALGLPDAMGQLLRRRRSIGGSPGRAIGGANKMLRGYVSGSAISDVHYEALMMHECLVGVPNVGAGILRAVLKKVEG
jgi:hypothetical protein